MKSAFLVAGTSSGCGKTTVTLGLMAALRARGLDVCPFKCGPDFIDPTLHRLVTGRESRNLDLWMCGHAFVEATFSRHASGCDIAVVEGVMGLYDGGESSGATLARTLGLPVVLVVDVGSAAESVAAVVRGFEELDQRVRVTGVILNRVAGTRHLELVRTAVEHHCRAEILGALPRREEFSIPARHLGLYMGGEDPMGHGGLAGLAAMVTERIDLERLLELTAADRRRQGAESMVPLRDRVAKRRVRIGVARDRAFCFYYQDNLDLLVRAGAELVEFSPLTDSALPENLQGLYFGGGYPELHGAELAANHGMLSAVRDWSMRGGPVYAECGGLLYLTEGIFDSAERFYPMVGVYPARAWMQTRRVALGYRQARLCRETILGPAGTEIRGHAFHYSKLEAMPDSVRRVYQLADGREGYRKGNTLGSYLHLHFGWNPVVARNFVEFCREVGNGCYQASEADRD